MKRFIRSILYWLGSRYYRLRWTKLVWWHIANRGARRQYRAIRLLLTDREQKITLRLREEGIAVANARDLVGGETVEALAAFARRQWERPDVVRAVAEHREMLLGERDRGGTKKAFLVDLWGGSAILDLEHLFIRFSLSDAILRVVATYLGLAPKFRGWRLEATIPTPPGVDRKASQRWHRDEEDRRLVKVFLYLTDVREGDGPFSYVRHSQQSARWGELFPMVPPRGSLPMPSYVDELIPSDEVLVCGGGTGTIIFCDTTGLHRGGFATTGHRIMYTSIYTSAASPWPIRYRYPEPFDGSILSPLARYAVLNNPNQREPRFYR